MLWFVPGPRDGLVALGASDDSASRGADHDRERRFAVGADRVFRPEFRGVHPASTIVESTGPRFTSQESS